ncbi:DddA-like double-stranded DNA deaminase toxin [Phytomonospora endophytica]|uniref:Uncharacterized protein n=1 Tax=Phytomonospora endophytica TaxID=714109 RepID=A0A841FTQ1_9ACTN|nr:DddA-like double-stranded DNA deaminase toxin [Phytomonospora endophytica]MBB6036922.1 hypothetical protein [Phytomonospora endophytica]
MTVTSGSDEPRHMVGAIGQACEAIDRALRELDGAARDVNAYAVQVGGSGDFAPGGTAGILPGQAIAPALRPGAPTGRAAPAEWIERLPVWEKRRHARMRTRGLRIVDGFAVSDLCSGGDEYTDKVDHHWKSVRRPGEPPVLTVSKDIELKYAMRMRDSGLTDEIIVINKPDGPCAEEYGCDSLLSRFLPPGSSLTVCWPNGESRTYKATEAV